VTLARAPQDESVRWFSLAIIIAIALATERRIPWWPAHEFGDALRNWSSSIGELTHVPLASANWFAWCGWLLLLAPVLLWPKRNRNAPLFLIALLVATFLLTIWQARWSYFFAMILALLVPGILNLLRKPLIASIAFIIALFPIAQAWDRSFAEDELARRAENKIELLELRAISSQIDGAFIAPWWFSPALSYWARQPGVGGSSHESIEGIVETATFFDTSNAEEAMQICRRRNVKWIVGYDADRVGQNSSQVLGVPLSGRAFCYILDRRPSEAPPFLRPSKQTARFKLYRFVKL